MSDQDQPITVEFAPVELTLSDGQKTTVMGEPTRTPQLWVTPVVGHDGTYNGIWSLTHKPTGLYLITSDRPSFLRDVEMQLRGLDWSFDSRETAPAATQETAQRVLGEAIVNAYLYDEAVWTGGL